MIVLLSPSKTQNFDDELYFETRSQPVLKKDCLELAKILKALPIKRLASVLGVSQKLAELNFERYQNFSSSFNSKNSRQAILAFRGDVYTGIKVNAYKKKDFEFAQTHLRILSGLYGCLRPLDAIQPYRLEMKTKLANKRGKNLYEFWGDKLSHEINSAAKNAKSKCIVNLASNEYFKAANASSVTHPIVTPVFKEKKGKTLKTVAIFAKQARGEMADYIIRKKILSPLKLKDFNAMDYSFDDSLSTESEFIFVR